MNRWLLISLLWAVTGFAQTPAPPPVTPQGDEIRLPGLRITGGATKTIEATGKLATTNDILEFVACEINGRDYESLLALECKPSALKFALLLIGCTEGETNGSPLTLEVEWTENDRPRRVPVESLLIDRATGKAPPPLPFFFSGSAFTRDLFTSNLVFQADADQAHVALWWQPSILINLRGDTGNPYRGDDQGFAANPATVPKAGTPVKLILRKRE
jgi:hypothetical protein